MFLGEWRTLALVCKADIRSPDQGIYYMYMYLYLLFIRRDEFYVSLEVHVGVSGGDHR